MIKLKNITKTYIVNNQEFHAVNDVSININKGEIYGIIGYSGAGKSTLIRIINQLSKQESGEVIIEGQNIGKYSEKEIRLLRRKIGMIFQHFNLMTSKTVYENIEFPLIISKYNKIERQQRIKELLCIVGLQDKANSYPKELSGGQKQRVAIARALANNPNILLCDEATSALDPKTTDEIIKLLKEINKNYNLTIVMITHQMEVAQKLCHRLAVMADGKIVEENDVRQIFENPRNKITKTFISNVENVDIIKDVLNDYPNGKIIKLTFTGKITTNAIISKLIKEIGLDINIVSANINYSQNGQIGYIYCHIDDNDKNLYNKLIEELNNNHVIVEVVR